MSTVKRAPPTRTASEPLHRLHRLHRLPHLPNSTDALLQTSRASFSEVGRCVGGSRARAHTHAGQLAPAKAHLQERRSGYGSSGGFR